MLLDDALHCDVTTRRRGRRPRSTARKICGGSHSSVAPSARLAARSPRCGGPSQCVTSGPQSLKVLPESRHRRVRVGHGAQRQAAAPRNRVLG